MTVPGRTVLALLIAACGLMLAGAVDPVFLIAGVVVDGVAIALCLLEGRALRREPVQVTRLWPQRVQINRHAELSFRIDNRGGRTMVVQLRQPWPKAVDAEGAGTTVRIGPRESVVVTLSITARQRGRIDFDPLEVDISYVTALARWRWAVTEGGRLTVYPDLQSLYAYEQLRRSRALRQLGVHRQRTIGAGREFDQLRDYLPDDDYRDINWKATARRRRPVTNLYQAERSRDVVLCVDAGRMMGHPIGPGTALDRAVDAAVMLAHASQRSGDRIGLIIFRDIVETVLRPAAGPAAVNTIIERLVDTEPHPVFPSFAALVETLRLRQNHRSLVFLFTDLNDPQLATDLSGLMPLLTRRHMVVVVSLRDEALDRTAAAAPSDRQQLYEVLAARHLADERDRRVRQLINAGVQVLEADAQSISVQVINRYMAIKSRQLL